eukprot:9481581-Pyramimonas_sp.AAC.2
MAAPPKKRAAHHQMSRARRQVSHAHRQVSHAHGSAAGRCTANAPAPALLRRSARATPPSPPHCPGTVTVPPPV